ncbi:MAG TPA: patatin-like phospholipase family protein [Oscillospiraceae bacterium]|nr:patatin-like phospholipase family protein [Oscillospiraceae bacterium]
MKKAIAFSGGGSKGSYQVGVWQALEEFGHKFDIAVGTSIGAVNAAFYVQKDFELCRNFWKDLSTSGIMGNGNKIDNKLLSLAEDMESIRPFLKSYRMYKEVDVEPFRNILMKFINDEKFLLSDIEYALITVKFPSLMSVEITKKEIMPGMLYDWTSASCACFPVFPMSVIDNQSYLDGGYYDKLPIASAFKLGAGEVFAVDIGTEISHKEYLKHPLVKYLYPSVNLGPFMSFEHDVVMKNMRIGYLDTCKFFRKLYGKRYSFNIKEERKEFFELLAYRFVSKLSVTETYSKRSENIINKSAVSARCSHFLTERLYYGKTPIDYLIAAFEVCADYIYDGDEEIIDVDKFTQLLLLVISESGFKFALSVEENMAEIKKLIKSVNHLHKKDRVPSTEEALIMLAVFTALCE